MKKFLTLLFFMIFVKFAFAQVSTITGQYLQDTNLLLNPGFESGTVKWSLTNGTMEVTNDEAVLLQGRKSLKVLLASQPLELYQDSVSYADAIIGMQAKAEISIKTDLAGIEVCVRKNFVTDTDCLPVYNDNKYHTYTIPFILDGISNGIVVKSSSSLTGLVYFDDAYVGRSDEIAYVLSDTIKLKYEKSNTQTITTSSATTAIYSNVVYDNSAGSYDVSTGIFTSPKDAYYQVCGYWMWSSASWPVNVAMYLYVLDNIVFRYETQTTNNDSYNMRGCNTMYLKAWETISPVRVQQNSGSDKSNFADGDYNFFTLEEQPYNEAVASQSITLTEQTANKFSAVVNSTGSVINETFDFINGSCSKAGAGQFACSFNSGIFNAAPNLVATINSNSSSCNTVQIFSTLGTGFSAYTKDSSGTLTDCSFNIFAEKTGNDYNKSGVIVGKFKNINSTDLVKLKYTRSTSQSIPPNVATTAVFPTPVYDNSNGAYNTSTGVFTAPKSSYYHACAYWLWNAASWGAGEAMYMYVWDRIPYRFETTTTNTDYYRMGGCNTIYLDAGESYSPVRVQQASSVNRSNFGDSFYNYFTIEEQPDYEAIVKNLYENVEKCQTKFLTADLTADTNPITSLTFSNISIGKKYRACTNIRAVCPTAVDNITFNSINNSINVTDSTVSCSIVSSGLVNTRYVCSEFVATDSTLTHRLSSLTTGNRLEGNGSISETYVTLCELPTSTVFTTEW